MTTAPDGFRRWTLGTRRIGRRQRTAALLIAAIGAAVILALLRADVRGPVGTIVLLVVVPVVLIGAVALTVHALHCRRANRRNLAGPQPVGPPIQHVAAELRRLLWQHDRMVGDRDGTAMS